MAMRVTFTLDERVEDYTPTLRTTALGVERVQDETAPSMRVTFACFERVEDWPGVHMKTTLVMSEYATDLYEWETIDISELVMSTEPYPDLIGLTFPVSQKPTFSTNVQGHTSGRETRTSYYENPIWEFTLSYDYLPNPAIKDSDYKKLVGFFLARKGSFETFLFYNRDDQNVVDGFIGTGDGVTASYPFAKEWGSWVEPVGFVDTGSTVNVYVRDTETGTIAGGTHLFTLSHIPLSPADVYTVTVGGAVLTPTASTSPGTSEYHLSGNTILVAPGRDGQGAEVDYKYQLTAGAEFTVGLPNSLMLGNAPAEGAVVTATFRYAYVCRFKDDQADFDQFMDKLYEFDQVNLRSVPA